MDIDKLKEFIVLAECLNYSKAANRLFITQPVLSRHIHDLEDLIGSRLFERNTHKVELSPTGKIFYQEALKIVETCEEALGKVRDAANGITGSLKIGFLNAAVEPFLRDFVLQFRKEEPTIRLDYEAMELDEVISAVKNGKVDVGFATHISEEKDLTIKELFTDNLCIVVSKDNAISKDRSSVTIKELDDEPMICLSKEGHLTTYNFTQRLFKNHDSTFNIVRYVPNFDTGIFFASLDLGVFVIPEHLSHTVPEKYVDVLRITDDDSKIILNIIYKTHHINPVTDTFVDSFERFGEEHRSTVFH